MSICNIDVCNVNVFYYYLKIHVRKLLIFIIYVELLHPLLTTQKSNK